IKTASTVVNPNEPADALYGTTYFGCGEVYQLVPSTSPGSGYDIHVLYRFVNGNDGCQPLAGLYMDATGNLFGTTYAGGANQKGVVFELPPPAQLGGQWTERAIYAFTGFPNDGSGPRSVPVADSNGALYVTTQAGGSGNSGTIVKLTPN